MNPSHDLDVFVPLEMRDMSYKGNCHGEYPSIVTPPDVVMCDE